MPTVHPPHPSRNIVVSVKASKKGSSRTCTRAVLGRWGTGLISPRAMPTAAFASSPSTSWSTRRAFCHFFMALPHGAPPIFLINAFRPLFFQTFSPCPRMVSHILITHRHTQSVGSQGTAGTAAQAMRAANACLGVEMSSGTLSFLHKKFTVQGFGSAHTQCALPLASCWCGVTAFSSKLRILWRSWVSGPDSLAEDSADSLGGRHSGDTRRDFAEFSAAMGDGRHGRHRPRTRQKATPHPGRGKTKSFTLPRPTESPRNPCHLPRSTRSLYSWV